MALTNESNWLKPNMISVNDGSEKNKNECLEKFNKLWVKPALIFKNDVYFAIHNFVKQTSVS